MESTDLPLPEFADLPPATIPPSIPIELVGFVDENAGRSVGNAVGTWLNFISRFIDAERLEGVTIAWDYDAALTALDRGIEGLAPLTRSTERAVGVAMAAPVVRNGELKAHLVVHAGLAEALVNEAHQLHLIAIYTLAHEIAHVHDLKMKDRAMPGVSLKARTCDAFDRLLLQVAEPCWDEYIACLLSARFHEKQTALHEETFLSTLGKAKVDTDHEIQLFRSHRDLDRLMRSVVQRQGELLKFAAYLVGHLHGIEGTLEAHAPRAYAALQDSWFAGAFTKLEDALKKMRETYPNWSSERVYDPLKEAVWDALYVAGCALSRMDNGQVSVNVRQ